MLTDSGKRQVSTRRRTGQAGLVAQCAACVSDGGRCTHANQLFLYLVYNRGCNLGRSLNSSETRGRLLLTESGTLPWLVAEGKVVI